MVTANLVTPTASLVNIMKRNVQAAQVVKSWIQLVIDARTITYATNAP